jgi:Zn-dependent protease
MARVPPAHDARLDFSNLILVAPVLLFSMVAHEYAHGYAALKQGDPTAYQLGRLTWNPVKHIDPVMTILVPVMMAMAGGPILGGAKPVPVVPRNYRNYRRGDIIVSLAGIATNLVLAVLCALLVIPLGLLGRAAVGAAQPLSVLQAMLGYGVWINLVLAFFNLLPIPPLDGSHVMKHLLPPALSLRYQQLGRYGFVILIALLWFGGPVLATWLSPAIALSRFVDAFTGPYLLPRGWQS